MKYLFCFALLISPLFVTPSFGGEIQVGNRSYRQGILRCQGKLVGAEISIYLRRDGAAQLVVESGRVVQRSVKLAQFQYQVNDTQIHFESESPKVEINVDRRQSRSYVQVLLTPPEVGFARTIDIQTESYTCNPLRIAQ